MASNKTFRVGPTPLTAAVANLLSPYAAAAGGVGFGTFSQYAILKHVHVVNRTAAAVNCSFWLGLTGGSAAGTEVICNQQPIAANSSQSFYGIWRIDVNEFLTGQAGSANALTVTFGGEIGVAG